MEKTSQSHGTLKSTVLRRERRVKQESQKVMMMMGSHVNQSTNGNLHHRHKRLGRNTKFQKKETPHFNDGFYQNMCDDGDGDGDDDDEVGIEKKIMALQRLVPGGESFEIDKLFEETAGYILALQGQVKNMKALVSFFEELDKEKRKLGG